MSGTSIESHDIGIFVVVVSECNDRVIGIIEYQGSVCYIAWRETSSAYGRPGASEIFFYRGLASVILVGEDDIRHIVIVGRYREIRFVAGQSEMRCADRRPR